jgi:hypothetical protein
MTPKVGGKEIQVMRIAAAVVIFMAIIVTGLLAQQKETAKPVAIQGEIVDLHCHSSRGASGEKHAGCAEACISRGVPAGLVTTDGVIYLLLDEKMTSVKDRIAGKVGKPVTVSGTVTEVGGMKIVKATKID